MIVEKFLTAYRKEMDKIKIKNNFTDEQMVSYRQGFMDAIIEYEQRKVTDVQPIRHGRWIDIHEYCKMNGYIPSGVAVYYWCSECMKEQEKTSNFCPNCGADMREPEAIKG